MTRLILTIIGGILLLITGISFFTVINDVELEQIYYDHVVILTQVNMFYNVTVLMLGKTIDETEQALKEKFFPRKNV